MFIKLRTKAMAVLRTSCVLAWGCSCVVLALLTLYHILNMKHFSGVSDETRIDDLNVQNPIILLRGSSASILTDFAPVRPSEADLHSVYQLTAFQIPRQTLRRRLNSFDNVQMFQKLPQNTASTSLLQEPSLISNRLHQKDPSADESSEAQMQSSPPSEDPNPEVENHGSLQDGRNLDESREHQSNFPATYRHMLHEGEYMIKSNVPTRAQRTLRSMRVEASYQDGFHNQALTYPNAHSDIELNEFIRPSPLPPISTGSSDSQQEKENFKVSFQMLPRDTATPPQGPSPVHN